MDNGIGLLGVIISFLYYILAKQKVDEQGDLDLVKYMYLESFFNMHFYCQY